MSTFRVKRADDAIERGFLLQCTSPKVAQSGHSSFRENKAIRLRFVLSRPAEPPHDGASHHPVLILLGQERQFLGEMGDALLIGEAREAVDAGGDVGAPET